MQQRETPRGVSLVPRFFEARCTSSPGMRAGEAMTEHPAFNADNVDALLGNLTAGSFALALVAAATGNSEGTPASRVAAVLEERVKEAHAQLDGSHLA